MMDRKLLARINRNSLYKTLGIKVLEASQGSSSSRLDPAGPVCWPFPGQPHGGILFTVLDTTMAWALVSTLPSELNCTTIDLSIQYLAPAQAAPFTCSCRLKHKTGRLGFLEGQIVDADGKPVASGQATFRIIKFAMP